MTLVISQDDACTLASLIKHTNGIEQHRALDDALMEAYVLREMIKRGDYEVDLDE